MASASHVWERRLGRAGRFLWATCHGQVHISLIGQVVYVRQRMNLSLTENTEIGLVTPTMSSICWVRWCCCKTVVKGGWFVLPDILHGVFKLTCDSFCWLKSFNYRFIIWLATFWRHWFLSICKQTKSITLVWYCEHFWRRTVKGLVHKVKGQSLLGQGL